MSKAETLIERLTDAVAAHYAGDPSAAGLVLSRLPSGQAYVSVVRYRGSHGQGKEVVCSAQCPTLRETLIVVADRWHKIASRGSKDVADVAELVAVMKPAETVRPGKPPTFGGYGDLAVGKAVHSVLERFGFDPDNK